MHGQTTLSGTITDDEQKPVPNVNILVYSHNSHALIAFGFSGQDGKFSIRVQSHSDSLRIEITSVQYRNENLIVANKDAELAIGLVKEVKDLSEFVKRASPIERRGDTISYIVSTFAHEQDRSIADVLTKMPGIEVEPSGRILYQGEPIQNFYVEGLDLMDGRYGLVSNNMPHRSVATVQILENHQPIRILEERLPSHRSSLNITLKKEITTTGTARLGSGFLPVLWDANVTPMMFTKNFQLAGSYQANNTGNDAAGQLDALTPDNFRERLESNTSRPALLSVPGLSPPGFNENRYLHNNLQLLNANALLRLPLDLQLRTNLHFIYDYQQQQGQTRRALYTLADTLVFDEHIRNNLQNTALRGEITLTRNTKGNYLENKLEFQTHWDQQNGNLLTSGNPLLQQNLKNPYQTISNKLSMVKPLGKRLINISSYVFYDHANQSLQVSPGGFESLLHQTSYQGLVQKSDMQRVVINHSVGLSFGRGRWGFTPRAGFQYLFHRMTADLFAKDGNILHPTLFVNSPQSTRTRTYLETEIVYKRNDDFSVTAQLPLSHLFVEIKDQALDKGQSISRMILAPSVNVSYQINSFWRIRASYRYKPTVGESTGVHYAYMLNNYRSMHINDAPLQQSINQSYSLFLSHRNPLKSVFSAFSGIYSIRNLNLIHTHSILPDGSTIQSAIFRETTARNINLSARTSKYVSGLNTTLALQGSYAINWQELWVNESIFEGRNHIYSLSPKANIRITDRLSTELRGEWLHYDTWREKQKLNQVDVFKYFINILLFPGKNQHLALQTEFYQYSDRMNYFMDMFYRYNIKSRRIDLEIRWINILNHKIYNDYTVGSFMLLENQYHLRPMQLMATVRFSF